VIPIPPAIHQHDSRSVIAVDRKVQESIAIQIAECGSAGCKRSLTGLPALPRNILKLASLVAGQQQRLAIVD